MGRCLCCSRPADNTAGLCVACRGKFYCSCGAQECACGNQLIPHAVYCKVPGLIAPGRQ